MRPTAHPRTDDLILHIADDGVGRYVFPCTLCGTVMSRALAERSLDVMVAAGVTVTDVAPAAAAPSVPAGPPRLGPLGT